VETAAAEVVELERKKENGKTKLAAAVAEREMARKKQAEREMNERRQADKELAEREKAEREKAERDMAERDMDQKKHAEREMCEWRQAEREMEERKHLERETAKKKGAEKEMAEKKQAEREMAEAKQAESKRMKLMQERKKQEEEDERRRKEEEERWRIRREAEAVAKAHEAMQLQAEAVAEAREATRREREEEQRKQAEASKAQEEQQQKHARMEGQRKQREQTAREAAAKKMLVEAAVAAAEQDMETEEDTRWEKAATQRVATCDSVSAEDENEMLQLMGFTHEILESMGFARSNISTVLSSFKDLAAVDLVNLGRAGDDFISAVISLREQSERREAGAATSSSQHREKPRAFEAAAKVPAASHLCQHDQDSFMSTRVAALFKSAARKELILRAPSSKGAAVGAAESRHEVNGPDSDPSRLQRAVPYALSQRKSWLPPALAVVHRSADDEREPAVLEAKFQSIIGGFGRMQGELECSICLEPSPNALLIPCEHKCVCAKCAAECLNQDNKCPLCRQRIDKYLVTLPSGVISMHAQDCTGRDHGHSIFVQINVNVLLRLGRLPRSVGGNNRLDVSGNAAVVAKAVPLVDELIANTASLDNGPHKMLVFHRASALSSLPADEKTDSGNPTYEFSGKIPRYHLVRAVLFVLLNAVRLAPTSRVPMMKRERKSKKSALLEGSADDDDTEDGSSSALNTLVVATTAMLATAASKMNDPSSKQRKEIEQRCSHSYGQLSSFEAQTLSDMAEMFPMLVHEFVKIFFLAFARTTLEKRRKIREKLKRNNKGVIKDFFCEPWKDEIVGKRKLLHAEINDANKALDLLRDNWHQVADFQGVKSNLEKAQHHFDAAWFQICSNIFTDDEDMFSRAQGEDACERKLRQAQKRLDKVRKLFNSWESELQRCRAELEKARKTSNASSKQASEAKDKVQLLQRLQQKVQTSLEDLQPRMHAAEKCVALLMSLAESTALLSTIEGKMQRAINSKSLGDSAVLRATSQLQDGDFEGARVARKEAYEHYKLAELSEGWIAKNEMQAQNSFCELVLSEADALYNHARDIRKDLAKNEKIIDKAWTFANSLRNAVSSFLIGKDDADNEDAGKAEAAEGFDQKGGRRAADEDGNAAAAAGSGGQKGGKRAALTKVHFKKVKTEIENKDPNFGMLFRKCVSWLRLCEVFENSNKVYVSSAVSLLMCGEFDACIEECEFVLVCVISSTSRRQGDNEQQYFDFAIKSILAQALSTYPDVSRLTRARAIYTHLSPELDREAVVRAFPEMRELLDVRRETSYACSMLLEEKTAVFPAAYDRYFTTAHINKTKKIQLMGIFQPLQERLKMANNTFEEHEQLLLSHKDSYNDAYANVRRLDTQAWASIAGLELGAASFVLKAQNFSSNAEVAAVFVVLLSRKKMETMLFQLLRLGSHMIDLFRQHTDKIEKLFFEGASYKLSPAFVSLPAHLQQKFVPSNVKIEVGRGLNRFLLFLLLTEGRNSAVLPSFVDALPETPWRDPSIKRQDKIPLLAPTEVNRKCHNGHGMEIQVFGNSWNCDVCNKKSQIAEVKMVVVLVLLKEHMWEQEDVKRLGSLQANDILNMEKLQPEPLKLVKTVMEAVCILLEFKGGGNSWGFLTGGGASANLSWEDLLKEPKQFLTRLRTYNKHDISDAILQKLKKYVDNPEFDPAKVGVVSHIAKILCKWCVCVYAHALVEKSLAVAAGVTVATSGLLWEELGKERPSEGTQISNPALALQITARLQQDHVRDVMFTHEERQRFGKSHLMYGSYIKVGGKYYRATASNGFMSLHSQTEYERAGQFGMSIAATIHTADDSAAHSVVAALTLDKINQVLQKNNLPEASMLEAPRVVLRHRGCGTVNSRLRCVACDFDVCKMCLEEIPLTVIRDPVLPQTIFQLDQVPAQSIRQAELELHSVLELFEAQTHDCRYSDSLENGLATAFISATLNVGVYNVNTANELSCNSCIEVGDTDLKAAAKEAAERLCSLVTSVRGAAVAVVVRRLQLRYTLVVAINGIMGRKPLGRLGIVSESRLIEAHLDQFNNAFPVWRDSFDFPKLHIGANNTDLAISEKQVRDALRFTRKPMEFEAMTLGTYVAPASSAPNPSFEFLTKPRTNPNFEAAQALLVWLRSIVKVLPFAHVCATEFKKVQNLKQEFQEFKVSFPRRNALSCVCSLSNSTAASGNPAAGIIINVHSHFALPFSSYTYSY